MYDQIGGGFHRYSTDEHWHIPHFEKMLYDNAQLATVYLDAAQISADPELFRIAREILDYVLRDLSHAEGGFYSAEDADSGEPKVEGAFYAWQKHEIIQILGPETGELFFRVYELDRNILFLASPEETDGLLKARQKLFKARSRRPRPSRDDKIIASWNGLMVTAFSRAYQVMGRKGDLKAAENAARFVVEKMFDPGEEVLYRRWREGDRQVPGTADDYAFLIQGLVDLYEASFDTAWLERAIHLTEISLERFYDSSNGGFYMTSRDSQSDILIRVKEDADNVEPSASSVMVSNLLRLASFTDRADFREAAQKTLTGFGSSLKDHPMALPQMLAGLMFALSSPIQVVIAGDPAGDDTKALLQEIWKRFLPNMIVLLADGGSRQEALTRYQPFAKNWIRKEERATAYVCVNYACDLPTHDSKALVRMLA
jgi:uncharacterized protein YyaL (SSP411 family)